MIKHFLLITSLLFLLLSCDYTEGEPGVPSSVTYSHTTLNGKDFEEEKYKNTILNITFVPNITMNPVLGQFNDNFKIEFIKNNGTAVTMFESVDTEIQSQSTNIKTALAKDKNNLYYFLYWRYFKGGAKLKISGPHTVRPINIGDSYLTFNRNN